MLALAIFLCLVQLGTSILGNLFLPWLRNSSISSRHLLSHFLAVTMSGMFAATTFLSIQGILVNTVGERIFRRVTPLLQGASIMLLLIVLLLCPAVAASLELHIRQFSDSLLPALWFLASTSAPSQEHRPCPSFTRSPEPAVGLCSSCLPVPFYLPLAYRRRVRQLIEGATRHWYS